MSATAPRLDVPSPPDPDRDAPAAPAALPRVSLLLRIVHHLVAYGTTLIATLQQGTSEHRRIMSMFAFGTRDIALIIARIKCGLLRAAALEIRLNRYVERGRDVPVQPVRLSMPGRRKAAPEADAPSEPTGSELLEKLPTAEEIAEQVRKQPLGVVIGDICRDLGLGLTGMDGALREELLKAVMECGIDLGGFYRKSAIPVIGPWSDAKEIAMGEWPEARQRVAARGQPP